MMSRRDWQEFADRLLRSAREYAVPGGALFDLPGPVSRSGRWSDQFEGFARTFMLAAFRIAGEPETAGALIDAYAEGIVNGTDPRSPTRWPRPDEIGQARCESCSIALGLHYTRPWIWDKLDRRVQDRVVEWFRPMIGAQGLPDNNWLWFQLMVEGFLKSVGGPYDQTEMDTDLARIESWYRGDGWYSDGSHADNFDYYSGWAMQFLPFVYCSIAGDDADELLQRHRARLHEYLNQAQLLVGSGGAPVIHGRSVTYRFAMLAPYWMGALHDATPLRPGQTRRLAGSVVRQFLDHGAVSGRGLLSIGWHREFELIRQPYSGAGSPYWAAKGLAGLLLPATHPVWRDEEEPTAAETGDREQALKVPGWLVSSTAQDGVVRLVNHGGARRGDDDDRDRPWYDRYAYGSHAGPELGGGGPGSPVDSHVALVLPDGRATRRADTTRISIAGRTAVSRSLAEPPAPVGPIIPRHRLPALAAVTTASVVHGPAEVRLARVDPIDGAEPLPSGTTLRIGGYAVAGAGPMSAEQPTEAGAVVRNGTLVSAVRGLIGIGRHGSTSARFVNAFGDHSGTPWAASTDEVVPGTVYAAVVLLTGDPELTPPESVARLLDDPVLTVDEQPDGHHVTVRWSDDRVDTVVLPAPA